MALRNIVKFGEDTLRKKSRDVVVFDKKLWDLLDDLAQTMHESNGVGLAAPQVGILRRAVVVDIGEGVIELVNPIIVSLKGKTREVEGCLSAPDVWGYVERPKKVKVKAQDRHGNEVEYVGEDLLARAFCHEIDHLNGVLFTDLADEMVERVEK